MKIQLLITERCTHRDAARALVDEAIAETGVEAEVEVVSVRTDEEAQRAKVLGSPSIRVDGLDIEYLDREPEETQAGCRYYNTPAGWKPLPAKGMLLRAIQRAQRK